LTAAAGLGDKAYGVAIRVEISSKLFAVMSLRIAASMSRRARWIR